MQISGTVSEWRRPAPSFRQGLFWVIFGTLLLLWVSRTKDIAPDESGIQPSCPSVGSTGDEAVSSKTHRP